MELSGVGGSQVVVIPFTQLTAPIAESKRIAHAQTPALSSDGRALAFIREMNGRGTLWALRVDPQTGSPLSEPIQIVNNAYDVRDVTYTPAGVILFAAHVGSRHSIFSIIPGGQPRTLLAADVDVDAPAVSPDGHFVAFITLEHNRWHLAYVNSTTGRAAMLTSGDCNASSPSWADKTKILYATDCGRGYGLTALASVTVTSP